MTRIYRVIAGLALVALLLLGIEQYGEQRVQVKWDLERARNEVIANDAKKKDKIAAQEAEKQLKKDIENAKSEASRRAINAFLKSHGLLPDGSPVSGSGSGQANSSCIANDSTSKSEYSERIEGFAIGCALDAMQVMRWQEWAIREGLEVH